MTEPGTETRAAFARRIGVSRQRVTQLVANGLPLTVDGKRVDVAAALAWVERLDPARRAAGRMATQLQRTRDDLEDDADDQPPPPDADPDYWKERARKERALASRAEIALRREQGELVEVTEVRRAVHGHAKALRDTVMAFAMRVAPTLAAELGIDPGALHRVMDREIRALLVELAEVSEVELIA